ncbi:MAG: histidine--tRNA ligase, partial [Oscillibacter sp.]|nr:histidine--tRNA ligase [Oscillibacter sp.]
FKKKVGYADKLGIPYAVFMGEDEIRDGVVTCKDMSTGEQTKLSAADTLERIRTGLVRRESGRVILG